MLLANSFVENTPQKTTLESHCSSIEKVILVMNKHFDEPLSLLQLAQIAQLSPYHFNRIFRKITGTPPLQFLGRVRINAAKRLLLTTELNVLDICYEVGYDSIGSFTTRFTNLVGLSPNRFRHLAKSITPFSFYNWCTQLTPQSDVIPIDSALTGQIHAPNNFSGLIFVGLFTRPIPKHQPVQCTILTFPGSYQMANIPNGKFYVCAVAFMGKELFSFFLNQNVLTGVTGSISVQQGQVKESKDLILRTPSLLEPPLLRAIPILLLEKINQFSY